MRPWLTEWSALSADSDTSGCGTDVPKLGVVPHSKWYEAAAPWGFTVPVIVPLTEVTPVGSPLVAEGAPGSVVVNVRSGPSVVPVGFVATARTW